MIRGIGLGLVIILGMVWAAMATAQNAAGPQAGQTYVRDRLGDWEVRCVKAPEGQRDACAMYQLLRQPNGNPIAEIELRVLPAGGSVLMGATITVPLETLLPPGVRLSVDGGDPRTYEYNHCTTQGCVVRAGFSVLDVRAMERGQILTLALFARTEPERPVQVAASLAGFSAAYDLLLTN